MSDADLLATGLREGPGGERLMRHHSHRAAGPPHAGSDYGCPMSGDAIATVVAASIAAVVAGFGAYLAWREGRLTRQAFDRHREEDFRVRQLSELYGPLHMRRRESRELWRQLPNVDDPTPGTTEWMLIDHITEIQAEEDGRRRGVVERILELNDELADLIQSKAGLLAEFPAPESFERFLVHRTTLRAHWERGENVTHGGAYEAFPSDIDDDIDSAIEQLRTRP